MFVSVAPLTNLPLNKNQVFLYSVPKSLEKEIKFGQLVEIPFKNKKLKGVVLEILPKKNQKTEKISPKEIISIKKEIVLTKEQIKLCYWLKDYYLVSLGSALKTILSPLIITKSDKHRIS